MQFEVVVPANVQLLFGNFEPITDRDSGMPKRDKDTGFPLYRVNLMRFTMDGDGRPEMLTVKVPGEPKGLFPAQPVRIKSLMVNTWSFDGKNGVSFVADAITAAPAAPTTKAA
jgi:hypothetical protein